MDTKKILEMNYKLGPHFTLVPLAKNGWILTRSGSPRIILSSDENTEEELNKFVETHRAYNTIAIVSKYTLALLILLIISMIVSLFVKSNEYYCFNLGVWIVLVPLWWILAIIRKHNRNLHTQIQREDDIYLVKLFAEETINDSTKKRRGRPRKDKGEKRSSEIQK